MKLSVNETSILLLRTSHISLGSERTSLSNGSVQLHPINRQYSATPLWHVIDKSIPKGILRFMKATNDTTTLSLKTRKQVKQLAQMRAKQLGIPLGTLVNAFLRDLGQTGEVHFTIAEPITPKMEKIIQEMRAEIAASDTYGPFDIDEAEAFLDDIPYEPIHKN